MNPVSSEIENLQGQIAKLQAEVNRLSGQVAEPTRAMYYPDAWVAVWLVPKNAHSSLQAYLMDLGFARSLGSYIPDSARNLAIVRDPVERYVSSLWNSYGNTMLRNLINRS